MGECDDTDEAVTGTAELAVAGHRLRMHMRVPLRPARRSELLPIFSAVTDAVVGVAVSMHEAEGNAISCAKGCGACCRQLVPISGLEARHIRDLVDAMPEPRRTEIRDRFAAVRERMRELGILRALEDPTTATGSATQRGLEYFRHGIPCPFLEDESCSIHAERPLACREYLVVSPAEHCAAPSPDTVRAVKLPLEVSSVVMKWDSPPTAAAPDWVPLSLALDWADRHPDDTPARPGPEIVQEFFSRL